jgi:hypothetical protein
MKQQLEEIMDFDRLRIDDEFMYNNFTKKQSMDVFVFDLEYFND